MPEVPRLPQPQPPGVIAPPRRAASRLSLACLLLVCTTSFADAETLYITDQLSIGLHSGPAPSAPVIQLLASATTLTVLQRKAQLTRVRTVDGEEGWVDQAYLQVTKPSAVLRTQLESTNEALSAELSGLHSEVERLKSDLLDAEENRQRQLKILSRQTDVDSQALRRELDVLRKSCVASKGSAPPQAQLQSLQAEIERLGAALRRARENSGSVASGRIPSDTLRAMERLAQESREAKQRLAIAQARARDVSAVNSMNTSPSPINASASSSVTPATKFGPWHWALLGSAALLIFGLGNLWADFMVRRRHGGYRL